MTKREIAVLVCKIFGIYTFLLAVQGLTTGLFMLPTHPYGYTIPLFILLILGYIFFFKPDSIGKYMVSEEKESKIKFEVDYEDIQKIAFSVIGLFILASAIPRVFGAILQILTIQIYQRDNYPFWLRTSSLIEAVLRLGIGLWLFLGSRALVEFLRKIREAGVNNSKETKES